MATKEERLKAMQRKLMNYDRRMIVFMKKATQTTISMELDSPGEAVHLRQQMYRARKLMRDMDHPESPLIEGMQLTIVEPLSPEDKTLLVGTPISNKWDKAFNNAGIKDDFDLEGLSPTPPLPLSSPLFNTELEPISKPISNPIEPDFSDAAGPYGDDE